MPNTPGTTLIDFIEKNALNCNKVSRDIKCSQTALRLITLDRSRITASVAVRLAKYFNTKPEFWLLKQMKYDLEKAANNGALNKKLKNIKGIKSASGRV
jgi:addiction module HigA family antidote